MTPTTLREEIRKIVARETVFHRHYIGQVCDTGDPSKKGRVKVLVPILGWDSPDIGIWCWPRQNHAIDVPLVGDSVEIYFVAGDRNHAVYLPGVVEMQGMLPTEYSTPTKRLLFQAPGPGATDKIEYDSQASQMYERLQSQLLEITTYVLKSNNISLTSDSATEPFVLGNQLMTFLNNLVTALGTHVHPVTTAPGTTGPPAAPFTSPSGLLSSKIKGA